MKGTPLRHTSIWLGPLLLFAMVLGSSGCSAEKTQSVRLMNEGVKSYRDGNHGAAAEKLEGSVAAWPGNGDAHYMLGQIYLRKLDSPKDAIKHLDIASGLMPEKAEVWYQKGYCLTELKRFDEGKSALEKAIKLKPSYADAYYRLAVLHETQGTLVDAAKNYGKSIQNEPRKHFAYYNLGDLYFRYEKYNEAAQVFKNGVENNSYSAELHHGLGLTYLQLKRPKEALVEFQEALRLKTSYPSALYNLGVTYAALGDTERAKSHLELFLQNLPAGDQAARVAAAESLLIKIQEREQGRP